MKKIYLLGVASFLFGSLVHSQCTISGETSPTCENSAVQNLTTTGDFLIGPGMSGNDFDPAAAGVGTHTIDAVSTDNGYQYTVDQTGTFAPVTLSAPTTVSLTDDDLSAALPVGFNFSFFGTNYNQFYISSNGFLSFSVEPNGCCTGQSLPDAATPNNLIAFAWEDIDPGNGVGQILYETQGTAPNRRLIVEFNGVPHFPSGNEITVQTILYEGSNIIEIHTTNMPSDGGNHTQGVENADGTVAYTVPGRNSANWSATNDYVAFIPDMTYTVVTSGTFAPEPSTGTAVTLTDDDVSGALPVGFNFTFFGNSYTEFYISSNGFLSFDAGVSQGCCSGGVIPTNDAVNNVIAYHWNDLYPPGGGSITYETVGTAPNRRLLVTFTDQSHCCNSNGGNTSQVILYESSNIIEMHTTSATNDGSAGTQGIENAAGTSGYATPGRNSTTWTTTNDYVAFIPGDICASTTIQVNATSTGTDVQTACDSYTWIDGNTYTSDNNTATFTLTNAAGCDSVVTLDLTINNSTTGTDVQTACDSYTWIDGNTYTSDNNTATHTLTNAAGCDSVVTLDLTINNSTTGTDVQTACESYTWIDGNTYTSDNNTATFTLTNAAGCDSVVTLDLTILNASTGSEVVSVCDSYTVPSGDETYTSSGTYMDTIPNAVGCDSVITIDLTINTSSTGTDVQTACDSLVWIDGNTYTSNNNTATFTLTNAAGCDSVVTLDLTIVNATTGTDVVSACDSYTVPSGDETYTTSGTYMDTIPNVAGCDSVITIDLTINNSSIGTDVQTACDSYTWIDGNTYTSSNNTATFTLTNAAGCDSVVTLDLTINTVNTNVTNNSPTLTAEATSATYQWVSCDENYNPIAGETSASYTAVGNGDYAVIVTQNGCTDTSACETVDNIGLETEDLSNEISISPNPSSGKFFVTSTVMIEKITVIDNMGRIVKTVNVNDLETLVELSNLSKGAYVFKITSAQGVVTRNVIKQ